MATNRVYERGDQFPAPVGADVESGDPVVLGNLTGVALTDSGADGNLEDWATIQTDGVFTLPVTGTSGALEFGDHVYITSGGDITRTEGSNTLFGFALGELPTDEAGEIPIKLKN